ncbi:MAG: HRDC domain-containing protein [Pirellulales bacterium]
MGRVPYKLVEHDRQLPELLSAVAASNLVGFDTEFVAEDCFRPDLCLVQVSTQEDLFLIDPKGVKHLDPFWELLVDPSRRVIVHAGREEILFVYRATGKIMTSLFDIQLAMGILGGEYPASYANLLSRVLGKTLDKGETRTDWRLRPLSASQLEYAALDVLHLPKLFEVIRQDLIKAARLEWFEEEVMRRQVQLIENQQREAWHRIGGVQSMRGKQLGVVRALWRWARDSCRTKEHAARRVLRDDLLLEVAKRGWTDPARIATIRGLHHPGMQRLLPEIAACISEGLSAPEPPWPGQRSGKRARPPALLQQFLTAAMAYICRCNNIATAIVGTSDDVRDLIVYWLEGGPESGLDVPSLLLGWRGDLVGRTLLEIFKGEKALRVIDPLDDMPLGLCDMDPK